jgi:MFS-type transporter involved in bile tolerance (Atg22 family)
VLEFSLGEICELIDCHRKGFNLFLIIGINFSFILKKDESAIALFLSVVCLLIRLFKDLK